jgi:DNA-binding NtrC family response regulator
MDGWSILCVSAPKKERQAIAHQDDRDFGEVTSEFERTQPGLITEGGRSLRLLAVGKKDKPRTFPLGPGTHVVGRSSDCQISLDDDSLSRRHAQLTVNNLGFFIEDLGSTNGTFVGNERVTPGNLHPFEMGQVVEVGKVMLIVQNTRASKPRRRVASHEYFEERLEEECARSERSDNAFAVLRISVQSRAGEDSAEAALLEALRPFDVLARYAAGEYEILLLDAFPEMAREVTFRIADLLTLEGCRIKTGLALWGADGQSAASLVGMANARLRGEEEESNDETKNPLVPPSGAMNRLRDLIERVAHSEISIILNGETGVGKEVTAKQIHALSPRADRTFVGLNCAALSESLLESELFGHERGAFTGAVKTKPGLLEQARGGTVFLDEVAEMPLSVQSKLLRVLEERQVLRVGGLQPRDIDVRFVAATHKDLDAEVARGAFRQDLLFRLNGITLQIPPLRERVDEISGLAANFVEQFAIRDSKDPIPSLSEEALHLLMHYEWPGNIRELRNTMERAVLLCSGPTIGTEHLPEKRMQRQRRPSRAATNAARIPANAYPPDAIYAPPARVSTQPGLPLEVLSPFDSKLMGKPVDRESGKTPGADKLKDAMADFERERIEGALKETGGNQTRAAKLLGISRRTLIKRLDLYGIERPRKGKKKS